MQRDVRSEVFRFYDRPYLAELQLLGRWLRNAVDESCPRYPLYRLDSFDITVHRSETKIYNDFGPTRLMRPVVLNNEDLQKHLAPMLRHSSAESVSVTNYWCWTSPLVRE